ncbi:MAG TPA: FAD-dependent oxidoreductase [Bacteroidales bacterium]|jgi:glutamate synthase (NADPH/NADH) small chain|nr:FAD-dependent oxidoreductase [Bacteroidales bacterium]
MMKIKDILSPFSAWGNINRKAVTVRDPFSERPGADRYRGFHKNDISKCIGCGTCEAICENKAIDMVPVEGVETKKGDSGLRPMVDYGRCCWCALCVDVCTTGSLTMSNEYTWVSENPDDFRYIPGVDKKPWDNEVKGWKNPGYSLYNPDRVEMEELKPEERITNFMELVKGYSKEQAEKEADRCVSCGICVASCPAHMDIPGYIKAIRDNNLELGLKLLYDTNPLPEICGRVCTHRCEEVCSIGVKGDPLAIRWLKRYIADSVPFEQYKKILGLDTLPEGKKHVAIIGAGPSGISAAYYLRTLGYKVTIFEAKSHPGGATMYGIPKYRLPMDILEKEIGMLEEMGVEFRFNTMIGREVKFDELYTAYDAVFMGIGFEKPYLLAIENELAKGSLQAIDFLREVNEGKTPEIGDKVVVIGGGNVAMDAARVSRRLGAEVTILYRRRIEDMPSDPEEIEGCEQEGIHIITQAIPTKVIVDANNVVTGIEYLKAKMVSDEKGGRPKPEPIEGSETVINVTAVIGAIGQEGAFEFLGTEWLEKLNIKRGRIVVDENMQSSIPKLFAGGDSVNATADAISAIADGHKAAKGIDKLLQGL